MSEQNQVWVTDLAARSYEHMEDRPDFMSKFGKLTKGETEPLRTLASGVPRDEMYEKYGLDPKKYAMFCKRIIASKDIPVENFQQLLRRYIELYGERLTKEQIAWYGAGYNLLNDQQREIFELLGKGKKQTEITIERDLDKTAVSKEWAAIQDAFGIKDPSQAVWLWVSLKKEADILAGKGEAWGITEPAVSEQAQGTPQEEPPKAVLKIYPPRPRPEWDYNTPLSEVLPSSWVTAVVDQRSKRNPETANAKPTGRF